MLKVSVYTVDGGLGEWSESESIIARLHELRREGYSGKHLINELLTDDWGPPPSWVHISGTLDDGTVVDEKLSYD